MRRFDQAFCHGLFSHPFESQDSTWKMCFFVFGQTVREERWGGVEGVGRSGEGVGMETLGVGGWEVGMRNGNGKWEWKWDGRGEGAKGIG